MLLSKCILERLWVSELRKRVGKSFEMVWNVQRGLVDATPVSNGKLVIEGATRPTGSQTNRERGYMVTTVAISQWRWTLMELNGRKGLTHPAIISYKNTLLMTFLL